MLPYSPKMFKNTFQSGFLSILYSVGSKPLQIWDKKGTSASAPVSSFASPPELLRVQEGRADVSNLDPLPSRRNHLQPYHLRRERQGRCLQLALAELLGHRLHDVRLAALQRGVLSLEKQPLGWIHCSHLSRRDCKRDAIKEFDAMCKAAMATTACNRLGTAVKRSLHVPSLDWDLGHCVAATCDQT